MGEVQQAVDPEEALSGVTALPSGVVDAPAGEEPQPPHSRFGVLRHRHFRNVWLGAMVSNVGGWMEGVGVQWIVAHTAEQPLLAMGYLAAAQLGPTLLLGIPGGLLADRVNRKMLLLVTQAIMMLIAAALAVVSYTGHATVPVLMLLALGQGVTLAFNTPAWQVLTPRLVPRGELTEAITLNGLQFNLARVAGPALAGLLMEHYSATVLFVVNTASFTAVLAAVMTTPDAPAPAREQTSPWRRTAEALSFVFHHKGPRAVFLAMVVFAFLAAPLMRMLPVFVTDVFKRDESVFGNLLAVMGAGAVLGALWMRRIPAWYPKHHFIPLSIAGSGALIVGFCATRNLYFSAAMLLGCGAFWLWSFNSSFAAMQLLVDDRMRGRVMSVCNVAVFGAMPLGALAAGYVGDYIAGRADTGTGTQVGVGALGALLAAAGVVMLIWRTPEVDGLGPGEPGYERRPGFMRGLTARAHRPAGR